MTTSRPTPLLGRIALHLKMISMDQLAEATRDQGYGRGQNLGAILVEKGFVSEAQLQQILRAREQIVARHRAEKAVEAADPQPGAPATSSAGAARGRQTRADAEERAPAEAAAAGPEVEDVARGPTDPAGDAVAPARAAAEAGSAPAAAAPALEAALRRGIELGASDIHIHSGAPLLLRLAGRLEAQEGDPVSPDEAEAMVLSALSDAQRLEFEERGEVDLACGLPGLGRFRVNIYRQQRGIDGVFRSIPDRPPTLEDLGLPSSLAKFTNYHQGLVLVTGPANCGKSSTMAALVDIINEERREHILTVEDPVEVLQPSKRCVVNQRNVGRHTQSFARALRAALREDPDVIVIGELRDLETISLALTAAETGHLVLGTLHTNSAIRTLNRIIGVFPADQQDQIRSMVSESLRAVISQRLVPQADGQGRVPALEILVVNKAVGNLIRENKTFQLLSILQTGAAQGMCLLDESLNQLIAQGTINRDDALLHCDDPKRIRG